MSSIQQTVDKNSKITTKIIKYNYFVNSN